MHRVTIDEVAERADVSTATVSRALSGSRPVSPAVAARVRSAAEDLGYSVNSIARALRSNRTDAVGMVVPSISNPFFTSLVESVEHELGLHHKQLFLCDARSDPELERDRLRSLIARNVDGMIISPSRGAESAPALVEAARARPLVQLDRFVAGTDTDWVGVDDVAAMRLVIEHLVATGVRTAAFAGARPTNSSTERRQSGFSRWTREFGIRVRARDVLLGDYSVEWGEQVLERLSRHALPGAIVCADDLIALGVTRAARARGIVVPDEVAVTGYDDITFARLTEPPLTTVAQPRERIAAEAVRLLEAASGRPPGEPGGAAHIALAPRLVVRASSRSCQDEGAVSAAGRH